LPVRLSCAQVHASDRRGLRALDEKKRASRLRRQSLERLRAGLELRTKLPRTVSRQVACSLSLANDPALTGVRHRALAKLPDAEREQWHRLWATWLRNSPRIPVGKARLRRTPRVGRAADCYSRALLGGDGRRFWFEYAAVLLLIRDRLGYNKAFPHG